MTKWRQREPMGAWRAGGGGGVTTRMSLDEPEERHEAGECVPWQLLVMAETAAVTRRVLPSSRQQTQRLRTIWYCVHDTTAAKSARQGVSRNVRDIFPNTYPGS